MWLHDLILAHGVAGTTPRNTEAEATARGDTKMVTRVSEDLRIDPRLKVALGGFEPIAGRNVSSREELLAEENSESASERYDTMFAMMNSRDTEDIAPTAGLTSTSAQIISQP